MKIIAVALAAAVAVAAMPASAYTYSFNYSSTDSNAPFASTGSFTTNNALNGVGGHDITSISGTVDADPITGLVANPSRPNAQNSADGFFTYDNVYFGGNPVIDNAGVLFSGASGLEYNFFSDAPGVYELYSATPGVGYGAHSVGTLSVAAIPEPATWGLLLAGFGMVGVAARRRKTAIAA